MKPSPDSPRPDTTTFGDEELVAHLFGDADDPEAVEAALAASPDLRRRHDELRRTLELVAREPIPPRGADYGADVWRRIEGRLDEPEGALDEGTVVGFPGFLSLPERLARRTPNWLGLAAAALLLLAAGFLLGRLGTATQDSPQVAEAPGDDVPSGLSAKARERILVASLAEHFGRSERLLAEVANAMPSSSPRPTASEAETAELEKVWAAELLASNRLYRRAAEQAGQKRIAALLAELEPVLLELAHSDTGADLADGERSQLRRRVEEQGLLFKVRVTERRLGSSVDTL